MNTPDEMRTILAQPNLTDEEAMLIREAYVAMANLFLDFLEHSECEDDSTADPTFIRLLPELPDDRIRL